MINKLIFNKKTYSFSKENLNDIFTCLLRNEDRDEEEKKYVLSFVTNSFIKKTYDELDYHEFVLDASYRVSDLLCNIHNVFGETIAVNYAEHLSDLLEEEILWDSTDYFDSISALQASRIGKMVLASDQQEKFNELLAFLCLYYCVVVDHMQQLESFEDYNKINFVNGIGFKQIEDNGKKRLKPLYDIYDSSIEDYIDVYGVMVAPKIFSAVLKTDFENTFRNNIVNQELSSLFLKKYEQLTGSQLELKINEEFNGVIDPALIGKWYNVSKSGDHPVLAPMYHFSVNWFKEDGILKKSILFDSIRQIPSYEVWDDLGFTWKTRNGILQIKNNRQEELSPYEVYENKLVIGETTYFHSFEEALKNCE